MGNLLTCTFQTNEKNTNTNEKNTNKNHIESSLMNLVVDQVKPTSFEGMTVQARVISVYDGDTYTVAFFPSYHHENVPYVDSFRMFGFDAPEMKPLKSNELRDEEKECARMVKEIVEKKITNRIVWISFMKKEKYGRLMGTLYLEHPSESKESLNDWIVKQGLGKSYHGEKKEAWTRAEFQHIKTIYQALMQ